MADKKKTKKGQGAKSSPVTGKKAGQGVKAQTAKAGKSVPEKAVKSKKTSVDKAPEKALTIRVCVGTGGLAAGSQGVIDAFYRELSARGISAAIEKKCVTKTGCRGFCARDVIVDVILDGEPSTYQYMKADRVPRVVQEHIMGGEPVEEWLAGEDYHNFHFGQTKILLRHCGQIDPEDINAYINVGGYKAAKKALTWKPSEIIEEVKASGLRGRGGGGFLTGLKWEFCKMSKGSPKYIICNADEGGPGAFMDRAIIEGNPHSVIEGLIIGALAISAETGYVFTRAEYTVAVERLKKAIEQARANNFLGKNIFGSNVDFDIEIKHGAGAFVCGESTALMRSIEGKRGMPRPTPPNSVNKGLWNKPTVLNNVETLSNIAAIISRGSEWYASYGNENSRGTKVFALSGKVKNIGLIEVPLGISLKEIIYDIGGGIEKNRKLKAVQTGGPLGGCIPATHIDMPVDFESLTRIGSMMGSGSMVVMDDTTCMVDVARFFMAFTVNETCGKCIPCRVGTKRVHEILTRITEGQGREGDIDLLLEIGTDIKLASLCGLGRSAPNPLISTINFFRDEYEAHIKEGRCPAGVCKALRQYLVDVASCKMCGKCARVCPTGAVVWQTRQKAFIDKSKCVKCGACYDACPFKSII
ncbi:MAG: NADH-quinone oxidoreductase subunit NuoF [Nitrospiraceae bacterium]|nr:MAG: NADH-quinone oxidoreductase subunit NuoF [Nitrospiraceae bacterium]